MNATLELSVILCSYNRGSTLVRCLEQFCKQSLPADRWEVVLVNDGSKDDTHELVHAREWPFQLRYIRQENTGLAGARNTGIQAAKGKTLLLINDDTMARPDFIEQHLAAQKAHPHSMVLGFFEYEPWTLQSAFMQVVARTSVVFGYAELTRGHTYDYMFSYTCNLSLPAEAFRQAGLFDTTFKSYGAEDTEMGYRLEKAGYRVVYCPEAHADHAHALTVDEFIKRQINVGTNFARFFRIHPEVIRQPRWGRSCEFSRFQAECMVESQAAEIEKIVQEIHALEAAWKGATAERQAEITGRMEPFIKRIAGYFWMAGLAKGMAREDLNSFSQLPDRRLAMIPGAFGQELATGLVLSVIIPTYNRLEVLKKCLAAIAAQTLSPDRFEVLVCDDGSTDGTEAFLKGFTAPYRFKNLRDRNQGPGMARNRGIAQAEGKIAVIINDDTILTPTALAQHLECHLQWNDSPIAVMGAYWPSKECKPTPFQNVINELFFPRNELEPHRLHDFRAFWTCNLSIALKPLRELGGFDDRFYLAAAEDTDLGIRLARQLGYRILYRPDIVSYHLHQHNFESFKRSCLARGRMTYHLVAKHPWLLSQWFGITEFDGRGVAQFKEQVRQLNTAAPQLEARMRAVEQLFEKAGPEATPALAQNLALQIQPDLAKLHLLYNRQGTVLELEREQFSLDALFTDDVYYKQFPLRHSWADRIVFSILLTVDDGADQLEATITSLSEQSFTSWEIILVDRSPDGRLRDKAKAILHRPLRCHYAHYPNTSAAEAIRLGMEMAQGSLYAVWPAGMVLHMHCLHALYQASKASEAGFLCPNDSGLSDRTGNESPRKIPSRLSAVRNVLWKRFFSPDLCGKDWWEALCGRIARAGFPARRVEEAVVTGVDRGRPDASASGGDASPTESLATLLLLPNWRNTVAEMGKIPPHLVKFLKQRAASAQADGSAELALQLRGMVQVLEAVCPAPDKGKSAPELSVVIPTYNRREKLLRCLDLLSRQTLAASQFEVIVVDDGSTDGTEAAVKKSKYPFHLQFLRQANRGPASARNQGIQAAAGEIVVFLGDDIYAPADFLESHLRHHRLFPDPQEALLGRIAWSDNLKVSLFMQYITGPYGAQFAFGSIRNTEAVDYLYFYTSNLSLKRSFLNLERPVFDEDYCHAAYEDTDLGCRLSRRGMRLRYRSAFVVTHDHPTDLAQFSRRQFRAGQMAVLFAAKHPETSLAVETTNLRRTKPDELGQEANEVDQQLTAECARLEQAIISTGTENAAKELVQLEKKYAKLLGRAYARGVFAGAPEPSKVSPLVSIIIPTFNRLELTRACLKALAANTPAGQCQIIAVDNGSTDATREFLKAEQAAGRITAILNEDNVGFARACNRGAAQARGEFVLFLNNDTEVQPGWLEPLVRALTTDARVAAAGSKLLFPDQTIQHAGIILIDNTPNGDPLLAQNAFCKKPHDFPAANQPMTYQALTAACLLVRKNIFTTVGGFDEEYWNGYEDVDLCLKIGAAGHLLAYRPESVVIHHESQSGPERFRDVQKNIVRLHQRWLGKVRPELTVRPDGSIVPTEAKPSGVKAPRGNTPLVSIIVLALNQLAHTRKCVESLLAHTRAPYEVILVDNGSTDGTAEYFAELRQAHDNFKVVTNRTNRGFAAGNNQGLALAKGEFVVLLNNDTIVTPGWIEGLTAALDSEASVGLVGPVSNRVSGPQQDSATYVNDDGIADFARAWTAQNAGQVQKVQRLVGFCLMARRNVIEAVGGLDEQFGSGNFEDDDFCLRAKFAGFGSRIARGVFLHHTGGQTFKGAGLDYRQAMLRNWELFRTKWELPADVQLERGYPVPDTAPKNLTIKVPLAALSLTHKADGESHWREETPAIVPVKMEIPAVARLGNLDEARAMFGRRDLANAWSATSTALKARPFHPEAHLLLAEIALAAGDGASARKCAQRAADSAPKWKAPKQFLQKSIKGDTKPEWLKLPETTGDRLTICVIAKNEEKFLGQCLASVKGLAHQIIVVDTGSTDRTVAIAKEHGAEVHTFAWCDDFSAARNAALEHVTGDWILMLDADEELPADQHARLRADMQKADAIAYRVPLVNKGEEAHGASYIPRLFRNTPGAFYYGRIHEQVFPSLLAACKAWGLDTKIGTAQLLHHGYTQEMVRDRNKVERNLKLLRQAITERPNDANLLLNLGLELVRSDELEQGLVHYREAFRLMSAQPAVEVVPELREVLLTQLSCHLYKVNAHDEVTRLLTSPLAKNGGLTASLHFALGLALFELKQYREAAEQMRQCLNQRKQPGFAPLNTDILTAAPQHCLALSLARSNDLPGASKAFEAGLAEPNAEGLRIDYAKFLMAQNQPLEALRQLHEVVQQNAQGPTAWRLGGEIALSQPKFLEFATDWTGEAIAQLPQDSIIVAQRAEALLLGQKSNAALPLWEKACQQERSPRPMAALIICATVEGQPVEGPGNGAEEVAVSRAFVDWYRRLLAVHAQEMIMTLNTRVDALRSALPSAAALIDNIITQSQAAEPAAVA